jgi:hypothetical protein
MRSPIRLAAAALVLLLVLPACNRAYYSAMEQLGKHKREILVDRVVDARDSQEEAKEEFATALEAFQALTDFDGGELEDTYNRLNDAYERSDSQAEDVRERIEGVQDVAEALFREWERELDEYESADLRRQSEQQLSETRRRYAELERAMERAADTMDPVLRAFRDQVLFLKHNLNAQAIASLEGTTAELQTDVRRLIADMEASIAEANQFVERMQT